MSLWKYVRRSWAQKAWQRWLSWALRCRLEPMKAAAKMIKAHLWEIINAVVLNVSSGPAESLNSRIKMIKAKRRGYRNKQRFINDIYFHLGGLDLYPRRGQLITLPTAIREEPYHLTSAMKHPNSCFALLLGSIRNR